MTFLFQPQSLRNQIDEGETTSNDANECEQSFSFHNLDRAQIKIQLSILQRLEPTMTKLWEEEVAHYESYQSQTLPSTHLHLKWGHALFPTVLSTSSYIVRNIQNAFPYHSELNALATCFELPPRQPLHPFEPYIEHQSPCSSISIQRTLLPPDTKIQIDHVQHSIPDLPFQNDSDYEQEIPMQDSAFDFLRKWDTHLHTRKKCNLPLNCKASTNHSVQDDSTAHQILLLLRLLRHSTSEMQMDLRLSRAILLLFADKDYLDTHTNGTNVLAYVLAIMKMDYIPNCSGSCSMDFQQSAQNPPHSCIDVSAKESFH